MPSSFEVSTFCRLHTPIRQWKKHLEGYQQAQWRSDTSQLMVKLQQVKTKCSQIQGHDSVQWENSDLDNVYVTINGSEIEKWMNSNI